MSEGSNHSGTEEKICDFLRLLEKLYKKGRTVICNSAKSAQKKFEHLLYTQYIFLKKGTTNFVFYYIIRKLATITNKKLPL